MGCHFVVLKLWAEQSPVGTARVSRVSVMSVSRCCHSLDFITDPKNPECKISVNKMRLRQERAGSTCYGPVCLYPNSYLPNLP